MKRFLASILVILFVTGALSGCGPNPDKVQEDFLAILDQPPSEETIKEASAHLDKYLPKMDKAYANAMVHKLEHYILGFNQEGIVYADWIKKYKRYLDPELLGYYQIMEREQQSPMAVDAVLQLSWEELVQRAYELEQFIRTNKDYILIKNDVTWIFGNYINAIVMGTTGTPIFDYKTKAFSDEASAAYAAFINKNPDSTVAWVLREYFTYLNSIGYTMDYNDKISSKLFFDTCDWLVTESGKRVFQ